MIIAAFLVSITHVIRKRILVKEHALDYLTVFSIAAAVIALLLIGFVDLNISFGIFILIYFVSLLGAVAFIFFMKALRHGEISSVQPLLSFTPAIVLVLSYFLISERVSMFNGLGVLLVLLGGFLIEHRVKTKTREGKKVRGGVIDPKEEGVLPRKYFIYAMIAVLISAFGAILDKILLDFVDFTSLAILSLIFFALNILLLRFILLKRKNWWSFLKTFRDYGVVISGLSLLKVLSVFLYLLALSLPDSKVSLVVAIMASSTLVSTIVGGELFHDHGLMQKIIAAVIMFLGVLMIVT